MSATSYPDKYLIYNDTRHSSESQIYVTPADSLVSESCIYIQPAHNDLTTASYTDKYSFTGFAASQKQLIGGSSGRSCMVEPIQHITLTLSKPLSATSPTRAPPHISSDENSWVNPAADSVGETDTSGIYGNGKGDDHIDGAGLEYWHLIYDSGPLTDGRFYSLYYENLDRSRMKSMVLGFVFGTYSLAKTGFVADAVDSAYSIEIDASEKVYGDQILFIASPYFLFSFGYGYMWFNYSYPITYSDGYTSSGEYSRYIELRTGLGGELGRYGPLQISGYAGVDARIYYGDNYSDYSGELFQDTLAFTLGSSIGLRY